MAEGNRIISGIKLERLFRRALLALALLMTFRTFQFFPGMAPVQEVWFAGGSALLQV
jgi:hypothetical protein